MSTLERSYQVLGVGAYASALEIRRQYRRLARQWHPDRFRSGSEQQAEASERMQEINRAYGQIRYAPLRFAGAQAHGPRRASRLIIPVCEDGGAQVSGASNCCVESVLRFTTGAAGGLVLAGLMLVSSGGFEEILVPLAFVLPLISGWLTLRFGDGLWRLMIELMFLP